jgi:hypothetical protein
MRTPTPAAWRLTRASPKRRRLPRTSRAPDAPAGWRRLQRLVLLRRLPQLWRRPCARCAVGGAQEPAKGVLADGEATTRDVASADNGGWSLYGAPWLQPVATSRKSLRGEKGQIKPKPLPWVATGCRRERMVRRGSAVRVRQRALQKPRKSRLSRSSLVAKLTTRSGYGAVVELRGF